MTSGASRNLWLAAAFVLTALFAAWPPAFVVLGDGSEEKPPSKVVTLNDENFEHLTQAASGATTGPWFVKFYSPRCPHCVKMVPAWEELAVALDGQVNVADLDATVNRNAAARFEVRGYPTLVFLKEGTAHLYRGARDAAAMEAFALGGYAAEGVTSRKVPGVPTMQSRMMKATKDYAAEVMHVLHRFPVPGLVFAVAGMLAGLAMGFFVFGGAKSAAAKKMEKTH